MSSSRLVRIALAGILAAGALSCVGPSEPVIERPEAPEALVFSDLDPGLLRCSPRPAAVATATIGPAGGIIDVGDHRLIIPAGALSSDVTITATAPASAARQVKFEPEGLSFALPARLTMSYANCSGALSLLPKNVAYTTDLLAILEILASSDDRTTQTVSTYLEHFSRYAVAW